MKPLILLYLNTTQTKIRKRINFSLPEDTLNLLDRIAEKGERSRLIDEAVRFYVEQRGPACSKKAQSPVPSAVWRWQKSGFFDFWTDIGHTDIKLTLQFVVTPFHNNQVMRPANFCHHWCQFCVIFIGQIENPHPPNIPGRKTTNAWQFGLKILSKPLNHGLAPSLSLLPFHDHPADIPIECDLLY